MQANVSIGVHRLRNYDWLFYHLARNIICHLRRWSSPDFKSLFRHMCFFNDNTAVISECWGKVTNDNMNVVWLIVSPNDQSLMKGKQISMLAEAVTRPPWCRGGGVLQYPGPPPPPDFFFCMKPYKMIIKFTEKGSI